ncbi:MAG: hypothetical protein C4291_12095 [Candidatus Dadabacteria bacterium]
MIKQSLRLVLYLVVSLAFGIIITLMLDQIENISVEENLRKTLESEIRGAAASFKEATKDVSDEKVTSFIKQYSSVVMKDKIIAVDRAQNSWTNNNKSRFLFTFSEGGRFIDFYIKDSFRENELVVLDTPELIFGVFATIVAFTSIAFYTEKRRQTKIIQQQFEFEHTKLRKALQEHEALALLGRMSATLAHELKTPLATISNLIQILPSRISDEKFLKRFRTILREELMRMQQLMDNLLVYGKEIEVKHEEWIELEPFIKTLVAKNNLTISCGSRCKIFGDRFYMTLLFENLLRNSQSASASEITIRVNMPSMDSSSLYILFEDNGRGFPRDAELERLTDPFVTWQSYGAGLGLYLVRKIASAHGGNVSLYRLDNGAGVRISFPRSRIKLYA